MSAPATQGRLWHRSVLLGASTLILAACEDKPDPPYLEAQATLPALYATVGEASESVTLPIQNTGGGTLDFDASAGADWLTVSPMTGTVAGGRTTDLAVAGTCPDERGTYSSRVTVSGNRRSISVPVSLTCAGGVLDVAYPTVTLPPGDVGAPIQASERPLRNSGDARVGWAARTDANWLTVSPSSGVLDPTSVTLISIEGECVDAGARSATVHVEGRGTEARIEVGQRCKGPRLHVLPPNVDLGKIAVGTSSAVEPLTVRNEGGGEFAWQVSGVPPWLAITPQRGALSGRDTVTVLLEGTCSEVGDMETHLRVRCLDGCPGWSDPERPAPQSLPILVTLGCLEPSNLAFTGEVELFQGPMVTHWGGPRQSILPILARRSAAFRVGVTHSMGNGRAPDVTLTLNTTQIQEHRDARVPLWENDEMVGDQRTFPVRGEDFALGGHATFRLDSNDEVPEPNEQDNRIRVDLGSIIGAVREVRLPPFRITFIPIIREDGPNPLRNPLPPEFADSQMAGYMEQISEVWPVASDYVARLGRPLEYGDGTFSREAAAARLLHRWYAEADETEYYHGVYFWDRGACGYGLLDAHVSLSAYISWQSHHACEPTIVAHEVGHSFGLLHADGGCGSASHDPQYPYPSAGIGPRPGWSFIADHLVEPGSASDIMSYCRPSFVSDYNYGNALEHRMRVEGGSIHRASHLAGESGRDGAHNPTAEPRSATDDGGSLALTGGVEPGGAWTLYLVTPSDKPAIGLGGSKVHGRPARLELLDESRMRIATGLAYVYTGADGGTSVWGARLPKGNGKPTYVVIRDHDGAVVLDVEIDEGLWAAAP